MAEFDPVPPKDADEAAYAQALLGDEAGREQRRARLMASLPRPEAAAATPVSRSELAWRWQPYAFGLGATALLLAAVLVLKGKPPEPGQAVDPRLAAAPAASMPVVVAQADAPPPQTPQPGAAITPPAVVRSVPAKPPARQAPPIVVADASLPEQRREVAAAVTSAVESAKLALAPPPPAEPAPAAAPVLPPPAAPVVAAAPAPPPPAAKPVVPPPASSQAETLARMESVAVTGSARARMSLAASDAAPMKLATESVLLAAVNRSDLATARSALKAGASVHQRDTEGRTLLMLAARSGSRDMVELLLAAGARQADRDPQGWTAADHAHDLGHDDLAVRLRQ